MTPFEGQSVGDPFSEFHAASVSVSVYSFSLSTATMLVSTSAVILTSQLRVWVTLSAYVIESPIRPGERVFLHEICQIFDLQKCVHTE